jgi:methionyl-tRNA formyltransferase
MKIALIMNQNSYAGRQYLVEIGKANINIDVICIGIYPQINASEELRCGGLWTPLTTEILVNLYNFNIFCFSSLKSIELVKFLEKKQYDICIQGGTGILKEVIINKFTFGILNFHPGDLPLYRGCSAPEWQVFENRPVYSTCHFIDEGIDTGDILIKKIIKTINYSYESFRASIYPSTSLFVVEVLNAILLDESCLIKLRKPQDNTLAIYRKYIGDEKISLLRNNFFKQI